MQYFWFHFLVLMHLLNAIYIIRTPGIRPSALLLFLLGLTTAVIVADTCIIFINQANEGWLTYYLIAHFFLGIYAMGVGLAREKPEPKPEHVTSEFEQRVLSAQKTEPSPGDTAAPENPTAPSGSPPDRSPV